MKIDLKAAKKKIFVIAEAGDNHNGSEQMAIELVEAAVNAGADAVKFQTFISELTICRGTPMAKYQIENVGCDHDQFEMAKKIELESHVFKRLKKKCVVNNIEFMSTPYDSESLRLLLGIGISRIKISSGDITNAPLLLASARTKLPIIIGTGMATLGEMEEALGVLAFGFLDVKGKPTKKSFRAAFCSAEGQAILKKKVTLLHCTTEYPAPFNEVNLRAMETINMAFQIPVGYSDHTAGISISIAAVSLGAVAIEKHFTLDKNLPGPDHRASLDPQELKDMITKLRQVEQALGHHTKIPSLSEKGNMLVVRRGLVAARAIEAGEIFTEENLEIKRPCRGLSPFYYWKLLGCKAKRPYLRDEPIRACQRAEE